MLTIIGKLPKSNYILDSSNQKAPTLLWGDIVEFASPPDRSDLRAPVFQGAPIYQIHTSSFRIPPPNPRVDPEHSYPRPAERSPQKQYGRAERPLILPARVRTSSSKGIGKL